MYFRFDVQGREFTKATHNSDENLLGNRAYFETNRSPPELNLDKVELDDEGIFICRVDFQRNPTLYTKVQLTVISK